MLIDNSKSSKNQKVHEWIASSTGNGEMDLVTGYFTIGALAYMSELINEKISEFRLVLGEIVLQESMNDRVIDLLNENVTLNAALKIGKVAKNAVEFLKQKKVLVKTLEPNFCHAKCYIFTHKNRSESYYLVGSSNLTEAGIGLKETNNVELNVLGQGTDANYGEVVNWFNDLWAMPQAHVDKTITDKSGKITKVDFKLYLIKQIEQIFHKYSPEDIYYKILFELYGSEVSIDISDLDFNKKIGRLEDSKVYSALYPFQQKGVLSLVKMLRKYNGAILADAVGLGKTWTALAVIKFFMREGYEPILFCPKKLNNNWRRYLTKHHSRFEEDQFDYTIRYHTDLQDDRLETNHSDGLKIKDYFQSEKPKLLVIDESHNLRNDRSTRYQMLLEDILKHKNNQNIKVLLLTATPINNNLKDIRNQYSLIVRGANDGFYETLDIRSLFDEFRRAQIIFQVWCMQPDRKLSGLRFPDGFMKLTDHLTVARTRKMVQSIQPDLKFPLKNKPINEYVTPTRIGNFESFDEIFDAFPKTLSAYSPALYLPKKEHIQSIENEQQRDFFLVKMMYILLVKRLESSWYSFLNTVNVLLNYHQEVLDKIKYYETSKQKVSLQTSLILVADDDSDDEFELGKNRPISIADIDSAGNLQQYKKNLNTDIKALENLKINFEKFQSHLEKEASGANRKKSIDEKLQTLIERIEEKWQNRKNFNNRKVLIFTAYKDTAYYLYDQLNRRGYKKLAVVSGKGSKVSGSEEIHKDIEPILERFAPCTKLFLEREWNDFLNDKKADLRDQYKSWNDWIINAGREDVVKKLNDQIEILISTDILSEGQNLQDCDYVVNYDIHWNPVRVIQRMGRIDRLASPNDEIFGLNFWPSDNINTYLNLEERIVNRMIGMMTAGAEIDADFVAKLKEKMDDDSFEENQKKRMMEQMQGDWNDLEVNDRQLGFNDLSLESFRQELAQKIDSDIKANNKSLSEIPKGIYSGFIKIDPVCPTPGIIALLAYPSRPAGVQNHLYKKYDLIYIDNDGRQVLENHGEVLNAFSRHKLTARFVADDIESGEENAIAHLSGCLRTWLESQYKNSVVTESGEIKVYAGAIQVDLLEKLKLGKAEASNKIKAGGLDVSIYDPENCDLLAWVVVSE